MNYSHYSKSKKDYLILLVVWLMALFIDRTWFLLDNSIPRHDQSEHLKRALSHYRIFEDFNLFSGEWWLYLWQLAPSYRAYFVYSNAAPFLFLFAQGYDQASLVNLLYSAIIILSVYNLGKYLFGNLKTAITARIFCLLFPILVIFTIDYLLD